MVWALAVARRDADKVLEVEELAVVLVRELLECLVVVHVHEHPFGRYEPPVARAARGRDHRFDAAPEKRDGPDLKF